VAFQYVSIPSSGIVFVAVFIVNIVIIATAQHAVQEHYARHTTGQGLEVDEASLLQQRRISVTGIGCPSSTVTSNAAE
jgi:hypothetical protein